MVTPADGWVVGHSLEKVTSNHVEKKLKVLKKHVTLGDVIIIASVVFLLVGAMLANAAAALFSASEPFGRISYLIGLPNEDDFVPYSLRFVAFFPLMLSAAMAASFFGVWAVLIIPFGYFPSLMMVHKHNKQVQRTWDSVTVADFYEDSTPLV